MTLILREIEKYGYIPLVLSTLTEAFDEFVNSQLEPA